MSGGTSIPYGNVKNMFILSASLGSGTSISIGTTGSVQTFTVPGLAVGDCILDVNRPSNTVNGNTAPAVPWVAIGNAYVSAANTLSVTFENSSTLAVSTPIETYIIGVGRPDTTVSGFYT